MGKIKKRVVSKKISGRKIRQVKAIILLVIAAGFLVELFYSRGSIRSYFSLIIASVCGLLGVLYLKGD